MPTPGEIVVGLERISNDWRWLSVLWHGYFAVFIVALIFGVRPSRRTTGMLLALPLLSVSILAWFHGNPFNGGFFGIATAILVIASVRLRGAVHVGPPWFVIVGVLMAGFGWLYPHFLVNANLVQYVYSAPTGLIPCPTTSIIIGISLILTGLDSRSWCLTLACVGLFYGVFGAARLGILIDSTLVAGALVIVYAGIYQHPGDSPKVNVR